MGRLSETGFLCQLFSRDARDIVETRFLDSGGAIGRSQAGTIGKVGHGQTGVKCDIRKGINQEITRQLTG